MKKIKFKRAFTIAEMIIVLIIIGIVMGISIHSIKQRQQAQYQKLYIAAYNALSQAVYEARNSFSQPTGLCKEKNNNIENFSSFWGTDECWKLYIKSNILVPGKAQTYEAWADGGKPGYERVFPGFLYGDRFIGGLNGMGTDAIFCKSIAKSINTLSESNQCKSFLYARSGVNWNTGNDFNDVFCASTYDAGRKEYVCDPTRGKINPSFIAANGQQFYISPIVFANPPFYPDESTNGDTNDTVHQKQRMPFRLVAVDLNGSGGPNTQLQRGKRLPDIVLFAINSVGDVIPLGVPEFSQSYAEAKVVYPKCVPGNPGDGFCGEGKVYNDKAYSNSMVLFDAKAAAWFGELHNDAWLHSYYGQVFMPAQRFSYSNLFYYWAINCKGAGCENKSAMGNNIYVDSLLANIVFQFIWANDDIGLDQNEYAEHTIVPLSLKGETLDTQTGCVYGKSASICPSDGNKRAKRYCCVRVDN